MLLQDRLKKILELKGITAYKLGEEIAIDRSLLGKYLSGKSEPGVANLILIAEYLDANLNWLLTGKGEMFNSKKDPEEIHYPEGITDENSNANEPPAVYGLDNEISITDPKFKEHSLLNSINNMSQAMIVSANTGERNSKNMEKLIDLLTRKIEEDDNKNNLKLDDEKRNKK